MTIEESSSVIEFFHIAPESPTSLSYRYPFQKILLPCAKAMTASSKTSLRFNAEGLLCLQCMLPVAGSSGGGGEMVSSLATFVEYLVSILLRVILTMITMML